MPKLRFLPTYEYRIVLIFFLSWGLLFLDRNALAMLMPLMVNDIQFNNSQIGQINMWQTIGYALSAPIFAIVSDRLGKKKPILVAGIMGTSVLAALTITADSYTSLLVLRTLLGAFEGTVLPIAITMVAVASHPKRFGRNVGFVHAGAAVIASTLGPVVVIQVAEMLDWHAAFIFVSIPSFMAAVLVWLFVEEIPDSQTASGQAPVTVSRILLGLKNRNIAICVFISIFGMAALWTFASFIPLFLVQVSQLPVSTMGLLMSLFGLVSIFWIVFLPFTSDKIGRKPAMVGYALLAAIAPALLFFFPQSPISIAAYVVLGSIVLTLPPLYVNVIPAESVSPALMATAAAVIMGIGELVGSFCVGISGSLADQHGLSVTMLISALSLVVVAALSLGLVETLGRVKEAGQKSELMPSKM